MNLGKGEVVKLAQSVSGRMTWGVSPAGPFQECEHREGETRQVGSPGHVCILQVGPRLLLRSREAPKHTPGRTTDLHQRFLLSAPPAFPGWVEFPLVPASSEDAPLSKELSPTHLTFLLSKICSWSCWNLKSCRRGGTSITVGKGWCLKTSWGAGGGRRVFLNGEGKYSLRHPPLLFTDFSPYLVHLLIKGPEAQRIPKPRESQTAWMPGSQTLNCATASEEMTLC